MERLTLRYERTKGDHASGDIQYAMDNHVLVLASFTSWSWPDMLRQFGIHARRVQNAVGVFQRLENLALNPYVLSAHEMNLFRTDIDAALKLFTYTTASVKPFEESVNIIAPVVAGIDALVDTFGSMLYLRVQQDVEGRHLVECPVCSEWFLISLNISPLLLHDSIDLRVVTSSYTKLDVPLLSLHDSFNLHVVERSYTKQGWLGISAVELLAQHYACYFLPRTWNPSGAWIAREDLANMLKSFEEERKSAS